MLRQSLFQKLQVPFRTRLFKCSKKHQEVRLHPLHRQKSINSLTISKFYSLLSCKSAQTVIKHLKTCIKMIKLSLDSLRFNRRRGLSLQAEMGDLKMIKTKKRSHKEQFNLRVLKKRYTMAMEY